MRPELTILVGTPSLNLRIDIHRSGSSHRLGSILSHEKEYDEEPAQIAELLSQKPRPAKEVILLQEAFVSGVVELPSMDERSWRETLDMEAQALSGIGAMDAQLGIRRLKAENGLLKFHWVQIPYDEQVSLRNAIASKKGCRLIAMGHPAGLHLGDETQSYVEQWSTLTLVHQVQGKQIQLEAWPGPHGLQDLLESSGVELLDHQTTLLNAQDEQISGNWIGNERLLQDESTQRQWAEALVKGVQSTPFQIAGLALLEIPKPPLTTGMLTQRAVGIAALVALALWKHYELNEKTIQQIGAEVTSYREPSDRLREAKQTLASLKRELAVAERDLLKTPLKKAGFSPEARKQRMSVLLDGLSEGANGNIVLLAIQPSEKGLVLKGLAQTPSGGQDFVNAINERLLLRGWSALLGTRSAEFLQPDGGPWRFEILLNMTQIPSTQDPE